MARKGSVNLGNQPSLGASSTAAALLSDEDGLLDALGLDMENLDITTEDISFDEVGLHIQENLEDDLIKQALQSGVDLREYAQQV
ncbi:hypothetical protein SARC_13683, partial [Sphaeroforma arctica JP610]